jgi:nitrogen-specific signal transduction histidine kinase
LIFCDQAKRAKSLVAKILTFSRRNIEQEVPIHLQPILQEVISLLSAAFPATITFHCNVREPLAPIVGNSSTIHEILLNIATNALHAMDEVGNLYFRCREQTLIRPLIGTHGKIPTGTYAISSQNVMTARSPLSGL